MWISSLALLMRVERGDYTILLKYTQLICCQKHPLMQSKREPVNQEMSNLFSISSCTSAAATRPCCPTNSSTSKLAHPKKTFAPFSPLVPSIMSKTPGLGCCYCILPATHCHFSNVSPTTLFFINSVIAVCNIDFCIHKNFKNKNYHIVYLEICIMTNLALQ